MKQIRVGIIGQGRSGRDIHGAHLSMVPGQYIITAVVDDLEERRSRAVTEFGCAVYDNYRSMIEENELDIVVNASPSHLHVPVTLDLLQKGVNVICEKPLAYRVAEVDKLIAAAEKSGKLFTVFQNMRFTPHFQQVLKVIKSGVLGRIVQFSLYENKFSRRWDWQTLQKNYGGNLLNTGSHEVDQAIQVLGDDVLPEIKCRLDCANTWGDAEDYVKLIMNAPGKPLIDIEISSCCPYPAFRYNLHGTCGGLTGTPKHLEWKYFKPDEAPIHELVRTPLVDENGLPAYCSETLEWYQDSWEDNRDEFIEATKEFYDRLYKTLTEGALIEVTPLQVRRQIEIIEECHRQNPLPWIA